jgi:uncharacterized protein (DUF302 family)
MKTLKTFLIAAIASLFLAACNMGHMMIHEVESPYDHDKTIETIKANALSRGWLISKEYNFQEALLKHKQPDPGKVTLVKVCHPEIATRLLSSDDNKYVSVMMPCSMSVYEKADGKTYVSSFNMGLMSKVMGSEVGAILKHVSKEDKEILKFLNQE